MSTDESTSVQWQKVLWKRQDFPDHYVPESFLESLRRNSNFRPYTYKTLVFAAFPITQHLSSIVLFVATYTHLYDGLLDPRVLVWACIFVFMVGFFIWEASRSRRLGPGRADSVITNQSTERRAKAMKSSLLVLLALMAVTPVLKTLTEATSSDSIWASSAILFILNALLADYSGPIHKPKLEGIEEKQRLTSMLSINAAISASVVLASRLRSAIAVFALVLLAVLLFALFPITRKRLKLAQPVQQCLITTSLAVASIWMFAIVSATGAILMLVTLVFVNLMCPYILVRAQRYKDEIRGPWDPAVPVVHSIPP